jgi:hypothetical protein
VERKGLVSRQAGLGQACVDKNGFKKYTEHDFLQIAVGLEKGFV